AVVAGAERLFFLLCRLDATKCRGMVGRDINPKVKDYIDFNVLLVSISSKLKKYLELAESLQEGEFLSRINRIAAKLKVARMPDKVKSYYQMHLEEFGDVYLHASKKWRNEDSFAGCDYYKCDFLFKKVKAFADAGNIISTTGPINDLLFLRDVSFVDTSNILQYSFLHLKVAGHPRVIWTLFKETIDNYQYRSYSHFPLSDVQTIEFNELIGLIRNCVRLNYRAKSHVDEYALWMCSVLGELDCFKSDLGPIYSESTLNFLRQFKADNILVLPEFGNVDLTSSEDIKRLNALDPLQIGKLCKERRTE